MEVNLKGKIALVTASSKGIGFGIANRFYQAGAQVCICARDEETLAAAKEKMAIQEKDRLTALAGDIGDFDFLKTLVNQTTTQFGHSIDILVNNSGGPPADEIVNLTEGQWQEALQRNLMSVIRLSGLVMPGMKDKHWGRIINLTSMVAKEPDVGMGLSNVTRAGVSAYSKTIAREWGPFGITVNTILTGGCLTERLYSLVSQDIEGTDTTLEEGVAQLAKENPVGYLAKPDEFSNTILFLASEASGYLTGTAIPLDGGYSRSVH